MKITETKHEQIEKYYINRIENSSLLSGEQLPSEKEISDFFNVSRHTVRHALTYLAQQGWIYKEKGKGSFISNKTKMRATKNVAVLTTYISDYIFPQIISGIEEELRKKGYNLLLFNSENTIEIEQKCFKNIINQDIAGIIVEPAQSKINKWHNEYIKKLEINNIKHLSINASCDERVAYIKVDDEQGGYKLTHYLLELGHKRIAAIFKDDDLQGEKRKNGYVKALEDFNIKPNSNIVGAYITDNQNLYIEQFIQKILNQAEKPTAILCYNDQVALKVIDLLRKENIKVPNDMSIVGFDDSTLAVSSDIKLTTINHPKREMGLMAGKCIIDMIEGRMDKPQHLYSATLIVRDSCTKI